MPPGFLLLTISIYAYLLPVAVGIVCWKYLTKPLKIYWFWHVVASASVILYNYFLSRLGHILEHILLGLVQPLIITWLFSELLRKSNEKKALWVSYALLLGYGIYNYTFNGAVNTERMSMLSSVQHTIFSFVLLRKFGFDKSIYQNPLFIALLAVFSESVIGIIIFGLTDVFWYHGLHHWYDLLYTKVMPFNNFIFVSMATYAFYLSRRHRRVFAKIPELET